MLAKATYSTTRKKVHHTPFLDKAQSWIWPLQVANIRVMRSLRMLPSLFFTLLVLLALIAWRPWEYANQWLAQNTDPVFQLDPFWTTIITVGAVIFLMIIVSLIPVDSTDTPSHHLSIGFRYIVMQLLSDPVGTLIIALIPIIAGLNPFFWEYPKPWYWKPSTWDWRRIGITIACMFLVYLISRVILDHLRTRAMKHGRKPHWLVLWRWLVLIALVLPDRYHSVDTTTTSTSDPLGKAQILPKIGSRQIGVSPITSPFGSLSRYPTARLLTRPGFARRWLDYPLVVDQLKQLLGNLAPWRFDVMYGDEQSARGWLVIRFAPPSSANTSRLAPHSLIGPPDPGPEVRNLSIEARLSSRMPDDDPFGEEPLTSSSDSIDASPDSHEVQAFDEDPQPAGNEIWVDDPYEQQRRELFGLTLDPPEGEGQ